LVTKTISFLDVRRTPQDTFLPHVNGRGAELAGTLVGSRIVHPVCI